MGVLQVNCPHCSAARVGMHIFGIHLLNSDKTWNSNIQPEFLAAASCPLCNEPVSAHLIFKKHPGSVASLTQTLQNFQKEARTPESFDISVKDLWPKAIGPNVPADTPAPASRAFLQAERNFLQAGNEEASALMYRRSLETALKEKYPDQTGSLKDRIDDLVKEREIPSEIGLWAHDIRIIGNDGAHDVEGVTREELAAIRGFADAVLRYLFTLPAQVRARKKPN